MLTSGAQTRDCPWFRVSRSGRVAFSGVECRGVRLHFVCTCHSLFSTVVCGPMPTTRLHAQRPILILAVRGAKL